MMRKITTIATIILLLVIIVLVRLPREETVNIPGIGQVAKTPSEEREFWRKVYGGDE